MSIAALAIGLSGCLVTDKISFASPPQEPPQIVDVSGDIPIGSIFWVDKAAIGSDWPMQVAVIDQDVSETLVAHFRLATGDDPQAVQTIDFFIPQTIPSNGETKRSLDFRVLTEDMVERHCYRLDLAVSAHFTYANKTDFDGLEPGFSKDNIARAQWWVLEGNRNSFGYNDANQYFTDCATHQIGQIGDAGTRM